jgi:hypothetical protein
MIALGLFALIGLTAMAHRSQFASPHGIQTDALAKNMQDGFLRTLQKT